MTQYKNEMSFMSIPREVDAEVVWDSRPDDFDAPVEFLDGEIRITAEMLERMLPHCPREVAKAISHALSVMRR